MKCLINLILNGIEKNSLLGKNYNFFFFAPKVESMENTNQFSKDEILIEKKSILTQELILGGHEMPYKVNLEKK